jgi:hypothetical protein
MTHPLTETERRIIELRLRRRREFHESWKRYRWLRRPLSDDKEALF